MKKGVGEDVLRVGVVAMLLMVGWAFFHLGIQTSEPVSPDYNVPIARTIVSGEFIRLKSDNPYVYYPGSSHVILAAFLGWGLPVNLFGVLSWGVFLWGLWKLGRVFGLGETAALMFAASFGMTVSVVRTIGDQSMDKWLAFWFVGALALLEKPERSWRFSLLLGLTLGMLTGTKFSGPLFAAGLVAVYWKRTLGVLDWRRGLGMGVVFTVSGLFWYIRNLILTGNPFYPANLPFLKGYPGFTNQDWMLWKIPVYYWPGMRQLFDAYVSEYLVWTAVGVVMAGVGVWVWRKKRDVDGRVVRLGWLTAANLAVTAWLPITTPFEIELFHVVSDMRYIYVAVVVQNLIAFILAEKYKLLWILYPVAVLGMIPAFSFVPYYPKIFLAVTIGAGFYWWRMRETNKMLPSMGRTTRRK